MESKKPDHQHIAALDGLRGVAAMAVVWHHMTGQAYGGSATPSRGYLAVDFFLILSGLVVARAYETRLQSNMTFLGFLRVRLIRLYPMIVLGIACGVAAKLVASYHFSNAGSVDRSSIFIAAIFGLLLLPYSGMHTPGGELFPLDAPLWSLMFELWINIFYACIVVLRNRRILWCITIAAILLGAGGDVYFAVTLHNLNGGHNFSTIPVGVARISCTFFIGVVLHHILTPARVAKLPSVPFPVLAILLMAVVLPGSGVGWAYDIFVALVVFPAIIILGMKDNASKTWRKFALFSGAISYPLYILHEPTFSHFTHLKHYSNAVQLMAFTAAFIAVVVFSYLALRFYDEPVRRWLTRATRGNPPAAPLVRARSLTKRTF
jgi:peptidoglycan/LPS O-acetylase OafA/YrhL